MRRTAFFFFASALLLALAGCRESNVQIGGKPPARMIQTVVTLNPGATEIVRSRAPLIKLVGRTAQCNWPPVDARIAVVMNGVKPNYERIAQLRPGLIVYDEQLFSESDVAKFKQLGIDTFVIKGDTIPAFVECLYDLGRELHSESEIMEYVDSIDSAIASAAGSAPAKPLKVAIMMPGKGGEHMIAGVDSFYANMARAAQGDPVGPKSNRFEPVNAEALVAMNPDLIVCSSDPSAIVSDPRLQSIAAVKNKKVGQIKDPDILLRRGGRVDKLITTLSGFFVKAAAQS